MSKRDNLLLIKRLHQYIRDFESNVEVVHNPVASKQKLNQIYHDLQINFHNDAIIDQLYNSELALYNGYLVENNNDKNKILALLNSIDLEHPQEQNKQIILEFLTSLVNSNKYFYQLSGVVLACMI